MRKEKLLLLFMFFIIFSLCFSSSAHATRSRLLGMGDLSIVIEDESNMINLWDFAHNPAGFLWDEKVSVIRSDLLREVYEIRDLYCLSTPCCSGRKCKADGDVLRSSMSISVRRKSSLAFGVEGNYFLEEREFEHSESELDYPGGLLVVSKELNSLTCVGIDIGYVEYSSKKSYKDSEYEKRFKTKYFQTELGAGRRLAPGVTLAVLLGYNKIDKDPRFARSDVFTYWFSLQSVVEVKQKLKLGLETAFKLRREDFPYTQQGDESYYYNCLRLRGIYDFTEKLRLGIFYFHNELFLNFLYPLESYTWPVSSSLPTVTNWRIGCSYKFNDRMVAGLEYHFRDSSHLFGYYPYRGYMQSFLNLGLETGVSRDLSIRAGYIGGGTDRNPPRWSDTQYETWENSLTLGAGYQPHGSSLILEIAYRYAFKEYIKWYRYWDVHAATHVLSLSFKKVL